MAAPQEIMERFSANVGRVRQLLAVYQRVAGSGPGRPSVGEADILRAAVLLLHAALEDLLRSIEEQRLPVAAAKAFSGILFPGTRRAEKFSLIELAAYRGQTVDDVFRNAVSAHLEHSNYNNINEVIGALDRAGIMASWGQADRSRIGSMMRRRHWIAHRADRNPVAGRGHHTTQSLGYNVVNTWTLTVEAFGNDVLTHL